MADQRTPPPAQRADLWSGLMFAGIGAAALVIGADYPLGTSGRIGPGYVPRLLSLLLIGLGAFLVVRSYWTREEIDTAIAWRPALLVLIGVIVFAIVFDLTGLVPAILASVAVANYAVPDNRWTTAVGLGAILSAFAWALFVYALLLPLPVFTK